MSCSSLKQRFDELKAGNSLTFEEAVKLYKDLEGSLDAHKIELKEMRDSNGTEIEKLRSHIEDGEAVLSQLKSMTLH